jgi:hypothetical protein
MLVNDTPESTGICFLLVFLQNNVLFLLIKAVNDKAMTYNPTTSDAAQKKLLYVVDFFRIEISMRLCSHRV